MARRFQEITEVYRQEIAALAPQTGGRHFCALPAGIISCPLRSRCWYTPSARTQRPFWK